jgi:hypothetical protein
MNYDGISKIRKNRLFIKENSMDLKKFILFDAQFNST